jgi:multidrug efflux system membrane fusion protein
MRRHITAGVLALAAGIAACAEPPEPPAAVIRPVRYQIVQTSTGTVARSFTGVAKAGAETTLSFRVAGPLVQLAVNVGDRVSQGDLIAGIDPADYELRVKEAEAGLRQAEALASNADADLRRVRGLYETNAASRDDYDGATAAASSARAQVEALTQRLEMARRQVEYTHLLAPTAGAIAEVRVELNENVAAGQAIAVMTSGGRPEVELAVPEGTIARIAPGQTVQVRFDALPGRVLQGRVTEVGVASGGMATTFPVTVALADDEGGVLPGMAASVQFQLTEASPASGVIVPGNAVAEDRDGRYVFVVERSGDGRGVARRRAVTVGGLVAAGLEITSGLSDGDLLVTAGVTHLSDGDTVRIDNAPER